MAVRDPLILAIDQGTSSTKALLVDGLGGVVASGCAPVHLFAPRPGHVEQSAQEIWTSASDAVEACLHGVDRGRVVALGVTNQRESIVLWDRASGRPVGPLLSWQDQRTAGMRAHFGAAGVSALVRERSGLPLDPMFSALKAKWLLDRYDVDRKRSRKGQLCLGTIDSWLLFQLSGQHMIEVGNASRTQLLDVAAREWDDQLLAMFSIPREALPEVKASEGVFCTTGGFAGLPETTPVSAVMGDSHAALFAQHGWDSGRVKATYGSGGSVMAVNPSRNPPPPSLCLTIAWQDGEQPTYALEGTIRSVGSTLVWLANLLGTTPEEIVDGLADVASDGIFLVPAFNGLAAPYWDDGAAGLIAGLRYSSSRKQLAKAALESICHQVEDVVSAFEEAGLPVTTLLADGGPTSNDELMQSQADISGRRIERSAEPNLSALGVAHMAGRAIGAWDSGQLKSMAAGTTTFSPSISAEVRRRHRDGWSSAVAKSRPSLDRGAI